MILIYKLLFVQHQIPIFVSLADIEKYKKRAVGNQSIKESVLLSTFK